MLTEAFIFILNEIMSTLASLDKLSALAKLIIYCKYVHLSPCEKNRIINARHLAKTCPVSISSRLFIFPYGVVRAMHVKHGEICAHKY